MRHEDAGLALWVASDQSTHDRSTTSTASEARNCHSVRQRAGAAVIALGERLAGDTRPVGRPAPRRRLAGQG